MPQRIQIKLSKSVKTFTNISFIFWNLHQPLIMMKQSWPSYFLYFGSYRLWKAWLHKCLNSPVSYHHSSVNIVEGLHLWNLHESTLIKLCCISKRDWLRKPLLLLRVKLLQLFVKTLTADHKYCLCNIWNLQHLIQMQICKKLKRFFEIFSPFLKYTSNFRHFGKKDDSHIYSVFPKS